MPAPEKPGGRRLVPARIAVALSAILLPLLAATTTRCTDPPSGRAERRIHKESLVTEDESILSRPAPPPNRRIAYGPGEEQIADVRFGGPGAEKRPLVVLLHGGFWRPAYDRIHTGPMAQALAAAGWTVATPEYRRHPGYPDATLADVRLALETLPGLVEHHDGKVLVIGHSAGGHLALWAAAAGLRIPLRGVVALAPVADLQLADELGLGGGAVRAFLGVAPEKRPEIDPRRMPEPACAVSILEGEGDEIVPPEVPRSYVVAHPKTRLVPVPGAGHFALIDPESRAWPLIPAELERLGQP
jgi:acetyl esterase/lipase